MNFVATIADLKEQLATAQTAHSTLTAAHKSLNEQLAATSLERDTALSTVATSATRITELEGLLAAAEAKPALTEQQIAAEVTKRIATAGVPPVQRDPAAKEPGTQTEEDSGKKGLARTEAAFAAQLARK